MDRKTVMSSGSQGRMYCRRVQTVE